MVAAGTSGSASLKKHTVCTVAAAGALVLGSGSHSAVVSGPTPGTSGSAAPLVPAPGKTTGGTLDAPTPFGVPSKSPLPPGAESTSYRLSLATPHANGTPNAKDQRQWETLDDMADFILCGLKLPGREAVLGRERERKVGNPGLFEQAGTVEKNEASRRSCSGSQWRHGRHHGGFRRLTARLAQVAARALGAVLGPGAFSAALSRRDTCGPARRGALGVARAFDALAVGVASGPLRVCAVEICAALDAEPGGRITERRLGLTIAALLAGVEATTPLHVAGAGGSAIFVAKAIDAARVAHVANQRAALARVGALHTASRARVAHGPVFWT
jgi:hypothetical protein